MLETIRQYALEQLDARDELEEAAGRHALHFTELAEASEQALRGDDRAAWLHSLSDDQPSVRAALEWTLTQSIPDAALRFSGASWRFGMRTALAKAGWLEGVRLRGADRRRTARRRSAVRTRRGRVRRRRRAQRRCRGAGRHRESCLDDDLLFAGALTSFATAERDGALRRLPPYAEAAVAAERRETIE